jgi:CIC family chloride channel protein
MVGMGAMVGDGTGAAMTAITMIFEMTLDYHIVLSMILAVAAGLGVRRTLSRENIYTAKLISRGHAIPKALHANMFLVRATKDLMERDFVVVPAATRLDAFLRLPASRRHAPRHHHPWQPHHGRGADQRRAPHRNRRLETGITFGDVASHHFTIVRESDVAFDVIVRLWRKNGAMAVVIHQEAPGFHVPRPPT